MKLRFCLQGPVVVLATVLGLVLLHESGHILAGWATGGHISRLDLFSFNPTVRIAGPATNSVNAIRALAGSGLVCAAWLFLRLATFRTGGVLSLVGGTTSFFASIELLGWFLSAAMHRYQPQANDAGKFLRLTGTEPLTVAMLCIAAGLAGFGLARLCRPAESALPAPVKATAAST